MALPKNEPGIIRYTFLTFTDKLIISSFIYHRIIKKKNDPDLFTNKIL
jgi:hypothetical protein